MPYVVNSQQIASVLALDGPERYKHFVSRVADWQELWGLRDEEGWATLGTPEGTLCLPFWPHPEYARMCATESWASNQPHRLELAEFLEWLHKLESEQVLIAVFPKPSGKGVVVSASELREHLESESEQY